MRVEGYISKKVIRRWLENYASLQAGDVMVDSVPGNSGPKNYDGISGGFLNRVMLEQAIESLSPLRRSVIMAKYVECLPKRVTLKALEISETVYYDRLGKGVDDIYRHLNREKADLVRIDDNFRALFDKIYK